MASNCLFQYEVLARHIQSFIARARTGHLLTKSYLSTSIFNMMMIHLFVLGVTKMKKQYVK